ncbi:MAG: hypothetical protein Q8Q47_01655 [Ignavibacteriaceae bacterium]|nr:hypothetical protein [Ignavibacteriaceae bacterium]
MGIFNHKTTRSIIIILWLGGSVLIYHQIMRWQLINTCLVDFLYFYRTTLIENFEIKLRLIHKRMKGEKIK